MIARKRTAVAGIALLSLALPFRCWSDDPKPLKEIAPGVFVQESSQDKDNDNVADKVTSAAEEEMNATDEATASSKPPVEKEIPDYRMELESGETIDVGEVFRPEIKDFQASLRKRTRLSKPPMIRLFHDTGEQPFLLAERRGKVLHGLFATFTEDGAPIAHTSYEKGDRASTLLTWDESKRPLIFAQYSDGKLDGIRCLFRGCCDACADGHPWLVQQWKDGNLTAAHLVLDEGKVKTFTYHSDSSGDSSDSPNREPYGGTTTELTAAMAAIEKFEKRLRNDEKQLKLFVAKSYEQDKQRKKLDAIRRNYQTASLFQSAAYPAVGTGGAMAVG